MKNYFRLLLCLLAVFIVSIGINVNAESEQSYSEISVLLPIHKTDEAGKGLEGAVFTLKDFNGNIFYSSSDEKNGDYLIEAHKYNPDMLDTIINSLPSNYKEVISGIKSWDDVVALQDRDDMFVYSGSDYCDVNFVIPLKVEESVVPTGYQKQDYVVTGIVRFNFEPAASIKREDIEERSEYFDDFYDNGVYVYANLMVIELPFYVPGYFEYNSSKDYEALYKELNKKGAVVGDLDSFVKIFEKEGYNTKDVDCPDVGPLLAEKREARNNFEDIQLALQVEASASPVLPYCYGGGHARREDIEARFDDYIEDCYCVINIKNKKQTIIVNPETAGTIGIVVILAITGLSVVFGTKKLKNN